MATLLLSDIFGFRLTNNYPETIKRILGSGLRDLKNGRYLEDKRKYEKCSSIDEYQEKKGDDFFARELKSP